MEYNTAIPSCKAEIKEFDNELFAVMDEHFGNSLLEWQKNNNKSVYSEQNKVSQSVSNENGKSSMIFLNFIYLKLTYYLFNKRNKYLLHYSTESKYLMLKIQKFCNFLFCQILVFCIKF